ncbi:MAG: recombination mediator RecR [Chlamydiota bacterium]
MKYPEHVIMLVNALRRLPGVGNKTAERYAFQMLEWKPDHLAELSQTVGTLHAKTRYCSDCGCLMDEEGCEFCVSDKRDGSTICVVSNIREVFAIEQMGEYKGLYHVLGGLLSPMDGVTSESLRVDELIRRAVNLTVKEVVIALDSTLEGDATALYLKKALSDCSVKITRLAFGIPMGSSLDYIDGGTLAYALSGRTSI